VVRLHEPQLRGRARHPGRPRQYVRAWRRPRAADPLHDAPAQGRIQGHCAERVRRQDARVEADDARHDRASRRHVEAGLADRSPPHDARRQQREDQLQPAAGRERGRVESIRHRRHALTLGDRRRPAHTPRRAGGTDGLLDEVQRTRRRAVFDARSQARRRQGDDLRDLQRTGRLHPAVGRRRRIGRIGRQLRLPLLLDQHASEGDRWRDGARDVKFAISN